MPTNDPPRHDRVATWLHAALAIGVLAQLALSSVMHVPPGRGLGVFDWHRQAFYIHARVGLAVAAVCALAWLWLALPFSRPAFADLFPGSRGEKRRALRHELEHLVRLHPTAPQQPRLVGAALDGLGLTMVSFSAAAGLINYLGYFMGAPIPSALLHWVSLFHVAVGYLLWVLVIAWALVALRIRQARHRSRALRPQPPAG
jgi:hypothetical protein